MKIRLSVSNGAKILVWRTGDTFHVQLAGDHAEPQRCLAVDLFEVIADVAEIDLDHDHHGAEATALAEEAQRRLPE
jgi:hypothetical protein